MPRHITRFMFRTPKGLRTLFSVIEKSNGELTITLKSGGYFGSKPQDGARVLEQRYSIHTSIKSADYNVMKLTMTIEDGRSLTLAALTDAVKKQKGFSILLARRCEDLSRVDGDHPSANDRIVALGEYDPAGANLYFGIFIGHPNSDFDATHQGIVFSQFPFNNFKIVIACSFFELPSYHTTEVLHSLTFPPESDPEGEEALRFLMTGRTPEVCVSQYSNAKRLLARRLIEDVLEHEKLEPETIAMLRSDLALIGSVGMIELGTEQGQPTVHMLSNAEIPSPLSERLHAQFRRVTAKP